MTKYSMKMTRISNFAYPGRLAIYRADLETLFGKNSTFRVIPIAEANLCKVRIDGFALPFSSLLMSPWAMPVRSESSF